MSVWHEFYIIFAGAFCFHIMIAKLSVESSMKTGESRRWCGGNNLPSVSTGEFHEVLISNYTKIAGRSADATD